MIPRQTYSRAFIFPSSYIPRTKSRQDVVPGRREEPATGSDAPLALEQRRFDAAYSSVKAQASVSEFRATIGLEAGARETFADMRQRGVWRDSASDTAYQEMVERVLAMGFHF